MVGQLQGLIGNAAVARMLGRERATDKLNPERRLALQDGPQDSLQVQRQFPPDVTEKDRGDWIVRALLSVGIARERPAPGHAGVVLIGLHLAGHPEIFEEAASVEIWMRTNRAAAQDWYGLEPGTVVDPGPRSDLGGRGEEPEGRHSAPRADRDRGVKRKRGDRDEEEPEGLAVAAEPRPITIEKVEDDKFAMKILAVIKDWREYAEGALKDGSLTTFQRWQLSSSKKVLETIWSNLTEYIQTADEDHDFDVACCAETIEGIIDSTVDEDDTIRIENVATNPKNLFTRRGESEPQRRGVGSQLIEHIASCAKERGDVEVRLVALTREHLPFYERRGFKPDYSKDEDIPGEEIEMVRELEA